MALDLARPGRPSLVSALMLLVGLTEGVGLPMIGPILQSLVPGAGVPGALGWLFEPAGPALAGRAFGGVRAARGAARRNASLLAGEARIHREFTRLR